jgi:predicted ATP-dependent endonuclease of OLD family
VGPNGTGKSAILMALNVFFQENTSTVTDVRTLSEEDFHHKNTKKPIRITVTLEDISKAAQEEFSLYYRQGKLVIFAEAAWDDNTQSAPVKHFGSRLVMSEFSGFFEAEKEGKRVTELREIYRGMRVKFPELSSESTKVAMISALREYEEKHLEKCVFIDEPNQFYGFTRGEYHLENYIQWVYVPAVKDASTEQEEGTKTALGQLLARTVRRKLDFSGEIEVLKDEVEEKYKDILTQQEDALNALELSMKKRLQDYVDERARLKLGWHYDAKASIAIREPLARANIGDADFIGEVARAGHGMQRGFLLAILHELVGNEEKGGPKLLLGFEEPELYQHPPQAQHLADVLERLSHPENNAQIIVTTHSPYFVTSRGFENIRMLRKSQRERCSKINCTTYTKIENRLKGALGEEPKTPTNLMAIVNQIMHPSQKELFFTPIAVIVEGPEDVAFISSHLQLSDQWKQFRGLGCHFIVAGGKCNVSRFVAIAQELGISVFVVFDGDGDEENTTEIEKHRRDNACILKLCGLDANDSIPKKTVWADNLVMWENNIGDKVRKDIGKDVWLESEIKVREDLMLHGGVKQKNTILITATLEELWKQEKKSASLIKLCGSILRYAEKTRI